MSEVTATCPDGSTVVIESNDAIVVHGVDVQGAYMGLVPPDQAAQIATGEPPSSGCHWTGQSWVYTPPLAEAQTLALSRIDHAAGAQRLLYITDVAGQQATYMCKAEEARSFLDAPDGPVPPYVQAEADALAITPLQAAQLIDATNTAWTGRLGPLIERERRRGKIAVAAATDLAGVQTALEAALAAIDQI